jgi:hypothetical protein
VVTAPNETSPDDGTAVNRRDGQRFQFLVDRRGCEIPQIIDRNIELYVSIIAFQFVLPEEFLKKNGPTVQISLETMMTVWSAALWSSHIFGIFPKTPLLNQTGNGPQRNSEDSYWMVSSDCADGLGDFLNGFRYAVRPVLGNWQNFRRANGWSSVLCRAAPMTVRLDRVHLPYRGELKAIAIIPSGFPSYLNQTDISVSSRIRTTFSSLS